MRIVLIGPVYPYRGGIAHHTSLLERSLRLYNHEVRVISFQRQYPRWLYPGSSDQDPSKFPLQSEAEYILDPIYPWTWFKARKRIIEFSPHLVVFQWWTTFWALPFANLSEYCRRKGIHAVFILHNVLPHEQRLWDAWLARRALRNGNTIIAQNPHESRRLMNLLPRANVQICEMPVFTNLIVQEIPKEEARRTLGYAEDDYVLLFFGIIRPYKGLRILLEALALLKEQGESLRLIVAGEFWEDPQIYQDQINQLDLAGQVQIVNRYIPNEEVGIYFSAADLMVAPYLQGTQSAVAALALSQGLRVILTERISAAIPQAYRHLIRVVPPGDARSLAEAIEAELLDAANIEAHTMPPEGDWERMVRLLESLG